MARYVNGLKYQIQDEMSTHYFHNVDDTFQFSLKVEENIDRKFKHKFQGKGPRGRGKASTAIGNEREDESTSGQSNKGGNGTRRGCGFIRVKGKYAITSYKCGVEGHNASKCLEKYNLGKGSEAKM
jgi:hypothetical protein